MKKIKIKSYGSANEGIQNGQEHRITPKSDLSGALQSQAYI